MKVLAVDDEAPARRRLLGMLRELGEHLEIDVVGACADGVSAIEAIQRERPDVVILDIAMPEVDGFDVLRHAGPHRPLVVFQTAHDEHAVAAFEHEALDYLLKPVTPARLRAALERASRRLASHGKLPSADDVARLLGALGGRAPQRRHRILARLGSGHRLVPLREISRVTVESGEVRAHTGEHRYLMDYTLAEIEQRGDGALVRVSRAELVNVAHVERLRSDGDGSLALTLRDGTEVHVSRRRAAEVRQLLDR